MKKIKFTLLFFLFICSVIAQDKIVSEVNGGVYEFPKGNCLHQVDRELMQQRIQDNIQTLQAANKLSPVNNSAIVSFGSPLKMADGLDYNGIYAISNFYDHGNESNYTCASGRTYSGHRGTDYFTWPFQWHLMENDLVEVVAAAPGVIIDKYNGNDDDNCGDLSQFENEIWNAVYIMHSDGSTAWYGHLKKNSLTSKAIGASVTQGEYLGIVASSGYSSGPHLHFEVFAGASGNSSNIDPYAGNCNNINSSSWWADQESYRVPMVNALLTHSAAPVPFECPLNLEQPNFSNSFDVGSTVYFGVYYRDQDASHTSTYTVRNPSGTAIASWDHSSPQTYNASYWFWNIDFSNNDPQGLYTWEVEYQGETTVHEFEYGSVVSTQDLELEQISISPNPFSDRIVIDTDATITEMELISVDGKNIFVSTNSLTGSQKTELMIKEDIPSGLYLLKISTDKGSMVQKLLKK